MNKYAILGLCISTLFICTIATLAYMDKAPSSPEVELRIEWLITEGKYSPINVSVGDILYGKGGEVQIKIGEVEEKKRESHHIMKRAKGAVMKGREEVEEGMKLYLVENPKELITIPEASVPSIEVVKITKR